MSTKQFNKQFWAHGHIEVQCVRRCLYIRVSGAVNKEGAEQSKQLVKDCVLKYELQHSKWGAITDFSDFQLATPDAIPVLRASYIWSTANGQRYAARVNSGTLQKEFSDSLNAEDFAGFESRYFATTSEAEAWFRELNLL